MNPLFPSEEKLENEEIQQKFPSGLEALLEASEKLGRKSYTGPANPPKKPWPQSPLIKNLYTACKDQKEANTNYHSRKANLLWDLLQNSHPSWHIHPGELLKKPHSKGTKEHLLDLLLKNTARRAYLREYFRHAPPDQREILKKKILEPAQLKIDIKTPKNSKPGLIRLASKTKMAWREFQNLMDAQHLPKSLTQKPEHCIPLAAHLTEKIWSALQKTALHEKNLGFIWVLQHETTHSEIGKSAILLAFTETLQPLPNGFRDPSTQTLITFSDGPPKFDLQKNSLQLPHVPLLHYATQSHKNPSEAKGELAQCLFETITRAFYNPKPIDPKKSLQKTHHLHENWIKKLQNLEIIGSAMGTAAKKHYNKTTIQTEKTLDYLIILHHASEFAPIPKEIRKVLKRASRGFRLLERYYSKKIQEFLN